MGVSKDLNVGIVCVLELDAAVLSIFDHVTRGGGGLRLQDWAPHCGVRAITAQRGSPQQAFLCSPFHPHNQLLTKES